MVCGLQFSGLISSMSVNDTERNLHYYPNFNKDSSKQVLDVALSLKLHQNKTRSDEKTVKIRRLGGKSP